MKKPECPMCRKTTTKQQLVPHMEKRRYERSRLVKCSSPECSWTGEFGKAGSGLKAHMENCGFRSVKCLAADCKVTFKWSDRELHMSSCQFIPVLCTHPRCSTQVPRAELKIHQEKCPWRPVSCEYVHIGCTRTGAECTRACHNLEARDHHLALAVKALALKNQGEGV